MDFFHQVQRLQDFLYLLKTFEHKRVFFHHFDRFPTSTNTLNDIQSPTVWAFYFRTVFFSSKTSIFQTKQKDQSFISAPTILFTKQQTFFYSSMFFYFLSHEKKWHKFIW